MSNVQDQLSKAISKGNVEEVENIFLNRGEFDVEGLDPFLLSKAICYNRIQVVKSLIKLGININAVDHLSKTPLHVASLIKSEEIVELLIHEGVHINPRDGDGNTPLHESIRFERPISIVKILLQNSASLTIKNQDGMNPVELALFQSKINPTKFKSILCHQHNL